MKAIAEEAATTPKIVKTAPHTTRVKRLDEVGAARKTGTSLEVRGEKQSSD